MKNFIKILAFILIFIVIAVPLSNVFIIGIGNIGEMKSCSEYFYDMPENSVDVLYLGSSSMWAGVSPAIVYTETGAAGFNRSTTVQTAPTTYAFLIEALQTQTPELVVLDAYSMFIPYDEVFMRSAVDAMEYSPAKQTAIDYYSDNLFTRLSFFVPYLRYCTSWDQVAPEKILTYYKTVSAGYDYLCPMGGRISDNVYPFEMPKENYATTDEVTTPDSESEKYFRMIIELCQEKDIDVMVLTIPNSFSTYADYNKMTSLCNEYGVKYFDLALISDELGVDCQKDFSDSGIHMNVYGNVKVSRYVAQLIKDNYDIPDRRGQQGYEFYDEYCKTFAEKNAKYLK